MRVGIRDLPDGDSAGCQRDHRFYGSATGYESLDRDGKGALLRREGLYTSLISEWRKQRDRGAIDALATKPGRPPVGPVERENARLRQQVERLEGDLERARKVINLSRKGGSPDGDVGGRGRVEPVVAG
jgi:hypothetical protein